MRRACYFGVTLGVLMAPTTMVAQDYAGFCGNYAQIASNGGACPNCILQIADNPETQEYFAHANNGWSAELKWSDSTGAFAEGLASWENGSGRKFRIEMQAQGFLLKMWMEPVSKDENWLTVVYACLD